MPKFLSEDAIRQYRDDGYFFPIRVLALGVEAYKFKADVTNLELCAAL